MTKRLGLIGGIAPESTIAYYRQIFARYREATGGENPAIIINSIDLTKMLSLVANDRAALVEYLSTELHRLADAGADIAAFPSNTPHVVFDELAARSRIPLISIVVSAANAAQKLGVKRAGLLGTRFTMEGTFYASAFAAKGIEIVTPVRADLEYVHEKYMGELVNAKFLDATRSEILRIIKRMQSDQHIDSVVLGGTELPLLLDDASLINLPVLDTTAIHVETIVDKMRGRA